MKKNEKRVIYLGKSIPIDDLFHITPQFEKITWISAFSIFQPLEEKKLFIQQLENLLKDTPNKCIIIGNQWNDFPKEKLTKSIRFLNGFEDIIK